MNDSEFIAHATRTREAQRAIMPALEYELPEEPPSNGEGAPLACADCGKPATGDKVLPSGATLPLCLDCIIRRMKAN